MHTPSDGTAPRDHWPNHAGQWARIGPPLRPSPQDGAFVTAAVRDWERDHPESPVRALILGVTPELATLPWPRGASLVAVDRSESMIEAVWPRTRVTDGARALVGEWQDLPVDDGVIDLTVGDGSFSALACPADYDVVLAEIARVLRPGGRLIARLFVSPSLREDLSELGAHLHAGRIGSFHVFKWRLAMALQASATTGVRVADVHRAFLSMCPDVDALCRSLRWSREAVATIEAYRDASAVYSFPTLDEVRVVFGKGFVERRIDWPGYELGDRCPTVTFERRD